jgi:uncharacterized protein (TIRG00374 family)
VSAPDEGPRASIPDTGATSPRLASRTLVRLAVSVTVLALLFILLPWHEIVGAMGRMRWALWLGLVAGFLGTHTIGLVKWRLMINACRSNLRFRDAVDCYAAGLFSNLCLPTIVGGDILRAIMAGKRTKRPEAVMIGGLADRISDVVALAILTTTGALIAGQALPGTWQVILTVVLGLAAAAAVILVVRLPRTSLPPRIQRRLGRIVIAVRQLDQRPLAALTALTLSLVTQGSFVLFAAVIGDAVGIAQPLSVWFLAWPVAKLSGLIPISLGGLAIREATLAAVLVPFGVAPALAVATSLIWQTVLIAGGLLSGLLWLRGSVARSLPQDAAIDSVLHV